MEGEGNDDSNDTRQNIDLTERLLDNPDIRNLLMRYVAQVSSEEAKNNNSDQVMGLQSDDGEAHEPNALIQSDESDSIEQENLIEPQGYLSFGTISAFDKLVYSYILTRAQIEQAKETCEKVFRLNQFVPKVQNYLRYNLARLILERNTAEKSDESYNYAVEHLKYLYENTGQINNKPASYIGTSYDCSKTS